MTFNTTSPLSVMLIVNIKGNTVSYKVHDDMWYFREMKCTSIENMLIIISDVFADV